MTENLKSLLKVEIFTCAYLPRDEMTIMLVTNTCSSFIIELMYLANGNKNRLVQIFETFCSQGGNCWCAGVLLYCNDHLHNKDYKGNYLYQSFEITNPPPHGCAYQI